MGIVELLVAVLAGIFIYLKLNDHEKIGQWSWWRVTSPLWLYACFFLVVYVLFFGIFGVAMMTMPGI